MRSRLEPLTRFIVTPRVAKHRTFVFLDVVYIPDTRVVGFCRDDDYFLGLLQSRVHEIWTLAQASRHGVGNDPTYNLTTCFETFPFPWPPGDEAKGNPRVAAIAEAARELNELRERWLSPPELTREETLEFPGAVDGPWSRYAHDPDDRGIGTVRWSRRVPRDADCAKKLEKCTLTNLYNARPAWLTHAHAKLDAAVLDAYGWTDNPSDDELLGRLLALNQSRA